MSETKEQTEAKSILRNIERSKAVVPSPEKNILDWSIPELRAYVLKETKGMNPGKKMAFARNLNKRIKLEKEKVKK